MFRTNYILFNKITKHHKPLLRFTILNKEKDSQKLGQFVEFIPSIVDIGNLYHCFILSCIEKSNLNVGWLVHTVLLDRNTNKPPIVSCYIKHFVAVGKLLIHS